MGVSRMTILEIFTNPCDLVVAIGQKDGKFSVFVSRGPGHNYKLMLSAEGIFESRQAAVDSIRQVLEFAAEKGKETLEDRTNPIAQIVNPGGRPVGEMNVLTQSAIDTLIATLATEDEARTF